MKESKDVYNKTWGNKKKTHDTSGDYRPWNKPFAFCPCDIFGSNIFVKFITKLLLLTRYKFITCSMVNILYIQTLIEFIEYVR